MKHVLTLTIALLAAKVASSADVNDGPFDGTPFRPNAPITWGVTTTLPQSIAVYKPLSERVSQAVISNAMAIGSFKTINRVRSKDTNIIEFRDSPRPETLTRFLKMSVNAGWIKYNDNLAGAAPVHGVPSVAEAEKRALRYFILLGGGTNQLSSKPWPHHEGTFETYDKAGGKLLSKGVSSSWVCLFRQIDGIQVLDNSLSVEFGNDAKPIMLDMNWPHFQPIHRYRTATRDEIVDFLKSGRAFYPVFPEWPKVGTAKTITIKSLQPLYSVGIGPGSQDLLRPFGSLAMEADVGGSRIRFALNCPITTGEEIR
jgi:hypothetical protein